MKTTHFWGEMEGHKGTKKSIGNATTGIFCHIYGTNIGIVVKGERYKDSDFLRVFLTTGKRFTGVQRPIATVVEGNFEVAVYCNLAGYSLRLPVEK